MQLFNDFCNYTLDENGVLNSFQLDYPENYNFGYDVVDKMGELAPNDIAMEWTNPDHLHKTFTFADIKRLSNKAANAFKNQGVKKGDRVIVILKRNYEYWYIVPALHKLGAIVIPATNMLTLDDITYRVDTADIRFAVSTPDGDTAETLVKASKERPILEKVLLYAEMWRALLILQMKLERLTTTLKELKPLLRSQCSYTLHQVQQATQRLLCTTTPTHFPT